MGITWGLSPCPLRAGSQQGRQIRQGGDGSHALGGEHAPALQLPVLVQFQQHDTRQAGDRGVVGEDAHHAGAALDSSLTRSSRLVLQTLRQCCCGK